MMRTFFSKKWHLAASTLMRERLTVGVLTMNRRQKVLWRLALSNTKRWVLHLLRVGLYISLTWMHRVLTILPVYEVYTLVRSSAFASRVLSFTKWLGKSS